MDVTEHNVIRKPLGRGRSTFFTYKLFISVITLTLIFDFICKTSLSHTKRPSYIIYLNGLRPYLTVTTFPKVLIYRELESRFYILNVSYFTHHTNTYTHTLSLSLLPLPYLSLPYKVHLPCL